MNHDESAQRISEASGISKEIAILLIGKGCDTQTVLLALAATIVGAINASNLPPDLRDEAFEHTKTLIDALKRSSTPSTSPAPGTDP